MDKEIVSATTQCCHGSTKAVTCSMNERMHCATIKLLIDTKVRNACSYIFLNLPNSLECENHLYLIDQNNSCCHFQTLSGKKLSCSRIGQLPSNPLSPGRGYHKGSAIFKFDQLQIHFFNNLHYNEFSWLKLLAC